MIRFFRQVNFINKPSSNIFSKPPSGQMNTVVQRQANSETIGRLRVRYVTAHRLQLQREGEVTR